MIPESVKDRLTEVELVALDAVHKYGSISAAARELKKDRRAVARAFRRAEKKAAIAGWSPDHDMVKPAAPGFALRGTSTLYTIGKDGQERISAQWVKTTREQELVAQAISEAVESLKAEIKPAAPIKRPSRCNDDLMNCYVITDYHIGALAWPEETGDDWDTDIAEQTLIDWFGAAIELAPNCDHAVLAQIGDYLHFDGLDSVTPTSGHVLDADTRFPKLVRVAINTTRRVVEMLLEKHQSVHMIMAEGNHDLASSVWLRELFAAFYANEPRVTVDTSPDPYYCVEHGLTSLFLHHGHKKPPKNIDHIFAAKFREVFGRTKYSYAHMGHLHHEVKLETNLMVVEQHPTLAGADSHASRGGWLSKRRSSVVTYSKRFGEVGRLTISPEMLAA